MSLSLSRPIIIAIVPVEFNYSLFKKIFSVSIPERQPCRFDINGLDQGTLTKSDIGNETLTYLASKDIPIDCIWAITVKEGWRVSFTNLFYSFSFFSKRTLNTPGYVYVEYKTRFGINSNKA